MISLLIITLLGAAPEKGDDLAETDNVAIASMLLMDGFVERAREVLEEVDPNSTDVDQKQLWRLRGIVAMKLDRHADAARFLASAIALGDIEPRTHLLLAQAESNAGHPAAALAGLERAPRTVDLLPESFLLHGKLLYDLDKKTDAFEVLDAGLELHPNSAQIERQRLLVLVELGLIQTAVEASEMFFRRRDTRPLDRIAIANVFVRAGQIDEAISLLEEAALTFPFNDDLRAQLAKVYLDAERPLAAAEVLRPLAWVQPERAHFAAGMYQAGGKTERALRMNALVDDQKTKLRQRLSLLIEGGSYELAGALVPRLSRLGLLEDQQIVYAVAFAHYQTGEHDKARSMIKRLTDARLFERGVELLRAVAVAQEEATR